MNKRPKYSLIALAAMLLVSVTMLSMPIKASAANTTELVIDVNNKMQSFDGWGTALAWWANTYGGHDNIVDGQEQRKNITDMIFTDKGLNLNIARYNLGTCETPENEKWDTVLNMPPYKTGPDEDYKWDNDPRQLWVLQEFLRVQKNNPITEMWVNTAPYWMTVSGSATGPVVKEEDNIAPEKYDDFAAYLVDILEHFHSEGIKFDYIEPMNEPNSGYTNYMGPHSGCKINYGAAESGVINALYNEQKLRGIEGKYPIAATDELSTAQTAIAWASLDEDAQSNITKINTHTYQSDKTSMEFLKKAAYGKVPNYEKPAKKLWMSERTLHMGAEPEAFYYGVALAQEIIDNIKIMGVNGWCHWQAPDELGIMEDSTEWRYDMQFFTFGNFTRYIVPGSRILNAGDDSTVVAITPDDKLVVVSTTGLNPQNPSVELNQNIKKLNIKIENAKVTKVHKIETTPESSSWNKQEVGGSNNEFSATLPKTSVTTYIFDLTEVGQSTFSPLIVVFIVLGSILLFGAVVVILIIATKKNKKLGGNNNA